MTLIQQAMIPLEPKLSVPVYVFPPTRVNTRMVQLGGATTHDMTCGLSLRLSELSPGDCCFQLMKEFYNYKYFFLSIIDCSLFEGVPLGGAARGSGFNGHFSTTVQSKLNGTSNVSTDRQRKGKGSKQLEAGSKILESSGTLVEVEAEKDYSGLFLDFDTKSKVTNKGKWTRTTNAVDDSPLFLLQDPRRNTKNTNKLQLGRFHSGVSGQSESRSHKWSNPSKKKKWQRTARDKRKRKIEERREEYDDLFLDVAPVQGLAGQVAAGSGTGLFAGPGKTEERTERGDKRGDRTGTSSLSSRSQPEPRLEIFNRPIGRRTSFNGLPYLRSSHQQREEPFPSSSENIFRFSAPPTIQGNMNRKSLRRFFIPDVEAERSPPAEISSFVRGPTRRALKAAQRGGETPVSEGSQDFYTSPSAPILSSDQPQQSLQPPTSLGPANPQSFYEPPNQPLLSPDIEPPQSFYRPPEQPQSSYLPPLSQDQGQVQPRPSYDSPDSQTSYQPPLSADLGPSQPQSSYLPPDSQSLGPPRDSYLPPLSPDLGPKPSYQDTYGPPLSPDLTPPQFEPPQSSSFGSQQQPQQSYQPPLSPDLGPKPSYEPPEVPSFGPSQPQNFYQAPLSPDIGPIEPPPSYKPQLSEDLVAPSYQPSTSQTSSLGPPGSPIFLEDSQGHRSYHIHSQDQGPSLPHTSYHIHVSDPQQLKLIQRVLQEDNSFQGQEQLLEDLSPQSTAAPLKSSYFPPTDDSSETLSLGPSDFPPSEEFHEDEPLDLPEGPRPTGFIVYKCVPKKDENTSENIPDFQSEGSKAKIFDNLTPSSNYILKARPFKDSNGGSPEDVQPSGRPPKYVVYKFVERKPKRASCYFWCK